MTDDVWTIKAALEWTVGYLERKGDENPRLSAEWLLSEATALRRIELYTNFERPLSLDERDLLRGYVTRRGKGEPLQYITGEVGFRHIAVKVRPGVLIPRPETEVLVSEALALLPPACRPRATDSRMTDAEAEALLAAAADGGKGLRPRCPKTAWAVVPGEASARRRTAVSGGEPEPANGHSERSAEGAQPKDLLQGRAAERERLLVADLCTGCGLHRLLHRLRTSACARGGNRPGSRSRGAGQRERGGVGARRPRGRGGVRSGGGRRPGCFWARSTWWRPIRPTFPRP